MAQILYGAPVTAQIKEDVINKLRKCRDKGVIPTIAIVRVGEKPDDLAYEKRVKGNCDKVGFEVKIFAFSENISPEIFKEEFKKINDNPEVHGILLFRPLPPDFDEDSLCKIIDVHKDIDCMNPENLNKLFSGEGEAFFPCTPEAVIEVLKYYDIPLQGANVVIVNRSMVLGKPLLMLMLKENATVTVCHSKTKNINDIFSRADIIVTGIGKPDFFGSKYFTKNNIVIDVGINFTDGRMVGDVNFEEAESMIDAITPVPGGIGTVTSMILLKHAAEAVWRSMDE